MKLAFVAVLALCCLNSITAVKVDVYYESLCPDSIRFIKNELVPHYNELKDFLELSLIPFGKASWIPASGNNPAQFSCQHGPDECDGNKAQACALYEIENNYTPNQQHKQVEVIGCSMSRRGYANTIPQCAQESGLSNESIQRINSCSRSKLGDDLLISLGERTRTFQSPSLTFVPSIAINGVKNNEAFRGFAATICKEIPDSDKPTICSQV